MSRSAENSQNHRMSGIGRDLESSSSPIPLPEQEHPDEVTQEGVQAGFECLQSRRLHNPPGQPVPVSVTLTEKKFLLKFKWNLLCSSLYPLPLVLSLVVTEKSLGPCLVNHLHFIHSSCHLLSISAGW